MSKLSPGGNSKMEDCACSRRLRSAARFVPVQTCVSARLVLVGLFSGAHPQSEVVAGPLHASLVALCGVLLALARMLFRRPVKILCVLRC